MANKNHDLDDGIIQSAMQEFMEYGYEKASLRKIATQANVTVGAIYTRYKTKDFLFLSMVEPLLFRIEETFESLKKDYYHSSVQSEDFFKTIVKEAEMILHLLFDDYDRAVLLFCKSRGSSLEHYFDIIVESKIDETIEFFEEQNLPQIDPTILKVLITAQFHMIYQIINEGVDLEEARKIMNVAMTYNVGGWFAVLNSDKKEK